MNLLNINNGNTYRDKTRLLRIAILTLGILVVFPSIYTNNQFFKNFFELTTGNLIYPLLLAAILLDIFKLITLKTVAQIFFESYNEEKRNLDAIGTILFVFLFSLSLLFSIDAIETQRKATELTDHQQQLAATDSTRQLINSIAAKEDVKTASATKAAQQVTAKASIINTIAEISEKNDSSSTELVKKKNRLKQAISDNKILFLFICELLSIFCTISMAYYSTIKDCSLSNEDIEKEVKRLEACIRSAKARNNDTLAEKHQKELDNFKDKHNI